MSRGRSAPGRWPRLSCVLVCEDGAALRIDEPLQRRAARCVRGRPFIVDEAGAGGRSEDTALSGEHYILREETTRAARARASALGSMGDTSSPPAYLTKLTRTQRFLRPALRGGHEGKWASGMTPTSQATVHRSLLQCFSEREARLIDRQIATHAASLYHVMSVTVSLSCHYSL